MILWLPPEQDSKGRSVQTESDLQPAGREHLRSAVKALIVAATAAISLLLVSHRSQPRLASVWKMYSVDRLHWPWPRPLQDQVLELIRSIPQHRQAQTAHSSTSQPVIRVVTVLLLLQLSLVEQEVHSSHPVCNHQSQLCLAHLLGAAILLADVFLSRLQIPFRLLQEATRTLLHI